ncbi:hypothetical protein IEQ34_006543 [Dendrobium chrysotoxum]|uniref:SURP motif domain-containing protein n=1 Tax=Dendrobium chrysotoxum TaxID=161865 RepID=A0AAV7H768_DENCH|nr:hypothetical protein IEQ34_006543 [Dendrobium chrysotoxum]
MDLEVVGRHALLFDDDSTASFVNSREALVPWNHDASLLIDRYDVRHLLDRIPPRPAGSTYRQRVLDDACDAVSLAELDSERYLDLPPPGDEEREDFDSATRETSAATCSGAYQAVPFSYGDKNLYSIHENIEYNSGFRPPFEVPEFLTNCLVNAWSRDEVLLRLPFIGTCFLVMCHDPPTEKLHQIMARTAIFVSDHGGQSEIVLRVKQGNNPTFGFLMPDHHLHAYFRYLVDHPQILKHYTDSPKLEEDKSNNHSSEVGALSLLGSVYGTGDDDDATLRTEIKETENCNLVSDGNATVPTENGEAPRAFLGNEGPIKLPSSTCTKEKPLSVKKISSGNATTIAMSRKTGDGGLSLVKELAQSSHKGAADLKSSILEPPSFLKRTIEKIVEFIVRNGKQFEAILIEQDRNFGRFPFLISTNQYHSYYQKIFEEAHEMKMQGKNLFDEKNDAEHHRGNKKKSENHGKDANINGRNLDELSDGAYYDPQRKEKFKMVLGGQKKDSQDQQSKATKHSGLSADEAAAIVLAATRGVSPANTLRKKSPDGGRHLSKNSGATADEAAAIVMAATRGRSPASAPQNMPRDNSRTSSSGSLQGIKPISKFASNGISGISVSAGLSGSTTQSDKKSYQTTSSDVTVATVIAKTVALAASREADSAEAALTKEQKLKAERLRRAKMFAAVIKSGNNCLGELVNSGSNRSGSMEPSTGGSMQMDTDSKTVGIEREGSSVPFDTEALGREHESRKRHHSRYRGHHDDSDSDEDRKHSRKKHHSSRHKDDQTFRTSHSSSKEKEARHRHKHYSSSEDERRHKRGSEHHHRHRIQDHSSDDEDREYSELRQRKHHSHSNRKRESEDKDTLKSIDNSEGPSVSLTGVSIRADQSASDGKQTSDATEIPNDLRAKIRAMLLETM